MLASLNYLMHKTKYLDAPYNFLVVDLVAFIDASCADALMPNKIKKKDKTEFNCYFGKTTQVLQLTQKMFLLVNLQQHSIKVMYFNSELKFYDSKLLTCKKGKIVT